MPLELHDLSEREILLLLMQETKGITIRLDKQNGSIIEQERKLDDLEHNRIRPLEDWRNRLLGISGLLTVIVVPLGIAYVVSKF